MNITLEAPTRFRRLQYVWDLLAVLVGRDIKLRYKRSVLGLAWSLVNPLAQFLILHFVFHTILPLGIPNYSPFLLTGILAWNWFHTALMVATTAIVDNRELIRRPAFPPAVLPLIAVVSSLFHFLLALPVLGLFVVTSGIQLTPAVLWLPAIIALEALLILSLAFFLATVHVNLRDTHYLLGLVLLLGFYLTPVFYDSANVPARYQVLYQINPMAHIIDAYRATLLRGQAPEWLAFGLIALAAGALLLVGYQIFTHTSYRFAEEL
jgi:lipopolysaccharide transport system permease protein